MKKTILILLLVLTALTLCACGATRTPADGVAFGIVNAGRDGNAYSSSTHGYYDAGTEIEVHAQPADGKAFYAWSSGGTLEDGGILVSYDPDYTFILTQETWLYPNFRDGDSALVLYHANGGEIVSDEAEGGDLWNEFSLAYYLYPNALADTGVFLRDGYTLVGYNTEPDGSGETYAPGWKLFEDTDAVIELWCVWREQSPADDFSFGYSAIYGGWIVDAYYGSDPEVSIPGAWNGDPVIGVAADAFAGNGSVESIVFPSTLKFIADGSCSDMTSLREVTFFDSLDYIADAAFQGDTALDTVNICAATAPHYSNWFNNHSKKVELMRYWTDDERPMLVILGGSSTAYAVDAQQLQSLLGREYVVLNCGTNGANLFNMTCRWAEHFMDEGDFLLQIIEYSAWQMGGIQCAWETFRSFEGCYNVFSWVPMSDYLYFYDCFKEFLDARKALPELTYEDHYASLAPTGYYDDQGTLTITTYPNGSPDFWQGRSIYFCDYWLYDYMVDNLNADYASLADMGIDYAMSYTPLNRNSLYPEQTDGEMEDFERYLAENLDITIISDLQDNIYDPTVFYDDDYHLASPARAEYTERLAGELNAYFETLD